MKVSDNYFDNDEFRETLAQYENKEQAGAFFLDAEELTDVADYYNYKGEKAKAMEAVTLAHERFPGAPGPITFLAREALDREDNEEASCLLEQIEDKDGPDYCYLRSELLIDQGKIDEADALLRTFLDRLAGEDTLYDNFILDTMELYIDYAVFDKPLEWAALTDRLNNDDDFVLMKLKALVGTMRNEEAVELAERLLDKNPYSEPYWLALALAQYGLQQFDEALKSCEYAIAIKPEDILALVTKANILFQLGNYEEAVKFYDNYVGEGPDNDGIELNLGMCLINLRRFEEAVPHLERAAQLALPESEEMVKVLQELVWVYGKLKQVDKAMAAADKLAANGENRFYANGLKVYALLQSEERDEAVRLGWVTAYESGFDPEVMTRVAIAFLDNNNPDYARQLMEIVYKTHPDYQENYSYLALACYELKMNEEFLRYLKKAEEMEPDMAAMVLGNLFPPDVKPGGYFKYLMNFIHSNLKK